MSPRQEGLVLLVVMLTVSCGFQILLKHVATDLAPAFLRDMPAGASRLSVLLDALLNWRSLAIAVCGACLVLLWLMALARLDLSLALPLVAVGLALNALVGGVALGETMNLIRIGGILVITVGVVLIVAS